MDLGPLQIVRYCQCIIALTDAAPPSSMPPCFVHRLQKSIPKLKEEEERCFIE
jgi:hypothetical protein